MLRASFALRVPRSTFADRFAGEHNIIEGSLSSPYARRFHAFGDNKNYTFQQTSSQLMYYGRHRKSFLPKEVKSLPTPRLRRNSAEKLDLQIANTHMAPKKDK